MKDKILSVLKSCKGRAGYYGITPTQLMLGVQNLNGIQPIPIHILNNLEYENKIYLTRSTQENNRGEITLICYRDHE